MISLLFLQCDSGVCTFPDRRSQGMVFYGSERRVHAGLVRNLVHASDNHPDNAFAYPQVVLTFAVSGQEEAALSHRLDRIVSFIAGSDLRHCTPRHTRAPGAMCPSVGEKKIRGGHYWD
jgi:hypothetical protein